MFLSPVVLVLVISGLAKKLVYPGLPWPEVAGKPILALLSELIGYAAVVWYMAVLVKAQYHHGLFEAVRWNWPRRGRVKFLVLGVVMMFALEGLAHLLPVPRSVPLEQFFKQPLDAYVTSLFAISFGPLMEELFFRGFLYPVLARRLGVVAGIFLTALGFGLIHATQLGFQWAPVLIIFLVGMVLTVVRAYTQSVASSFLVHVAYNSTLTAMTLIQSDGFRHLEKLTQ